MAECEHLDVLGQSPVDLSHHYSTATSNRTGSLVKDFYKYFSIPGIQNLAGGASCHKLYTASIYPAEPCLTWKVWQDSRPSPSSPMTLSRQPSRRPIELTHLRPTRAMERSVVDAQ